MCAQRVDAHLPDSSPSALPAAVPKWSRDCDAAHAHFESPLRSVGHAGEDRMVAFMTAAADAPIPSDPRCNQLCSVVGACVSCAAQSPTRRSEIESAIARIEARAFALRESGAAEAWLAGLDDETRSLVGSVNGPLFLELIQEAGHADTDAPELFRTGACMIGRLPQTGTATPLSEVVEPPTIGQVVGSVEVANKSFLASLRDDPHGGELLQLTRSDADAGRMTRPVPIESSPGGEVLLAKRFAVVQGVKVRPCDDETASGVNSACAPSEKLAHDHVDDLVAACVRFTTLAGSAPHLYKADIDSAFRRIPVTPAQRWLLGVVFSHLGVKYFARHIATPFGCVGSVHSWHRIGAALLCIARRLLGLVLFRYVDDFFGLESAGLVDIALSAFVRLVRAILGETAIAEKKCAHGAALDILGLCVAPSADDIRVALSREKASKWLSEVREVLQRGRLSSGHASKLAGKLSFAAQASFWRLGRAMVRPFFQQQYNPLREGCIGDMLHLALQWWEIVLAREAVEPISLCLCRSEVLDLFCDARSTPPRLAAVLVDAQRSIRYTDWAPPSDLMQRAWLVRGDNHIMSLELLAMALGLATFRRELAGKRLRVWTDNTGGEGALRRGSSKAVDHNRLVHATWLLATMFHVGLVVHRVPTDDNIADLPSREQYSLLD